MNDNTVEMNAYIFCGDELKKYVDVGFTGLDSFTGTWRESLSVYEGDIAPWKAMAEGYEAKRLRIGKDVSFRDLECTREEIASALEERLRAEGYAEQMENGYAAIVARDTLSAYVLSKHAPRMPEISPEYDPGLELL